MSVSINMTIESDTASPAVQKVLREVAPGRIADKLEGPVTVLMQKHFAALPPNKQGWPTTGFWKDAARATSGQREGGDLVMTVAKIGVRQRLLGGTIRPVNKQFLSIPARAEAYGKTPSEFPNLIVIDLGRQQGAPRLALVQADATRVSFGRKKKDGSRTVKNEGETGGGVIYWLVKEVRQDADPTVIPSDAEFATTIEQALSTLKK